MSCAGLMVAHGAGHAVIGLLEEDGPSGVVTLAKRDQNSDEEGLATVAVLLT